MARNINLPTGATRTSEVGLVWQEIKSSTGLTTFEIAKYSAVRIRSTTAGLTVSLDSLLAATMDSGEILILNVGRGTNSDSKETVTLTVSGNCYMQVGIEIDRP